MYNDVCLYLYVPMNLSFPDLAIFLHPSIVFLAFFLGLFLFWRAGRHELLDSDFLFDITMVCAFWAFLFARIFDFVVHQEVYNWSLTKLIFFNVYGGFDFYGGLFGAVVGSWLYLKKSKISFWYVFDLAAAPLAFGMSVFSLSKLGSGTGLYYFIGNFVIFVILKRLATKKRYVGFFACFFLVGFSLLDLFVRGFLARKDLFVSYRLILPLIFLILGNVCWYICSKRNLKNDAKNIGAFLLLSIFRTRRILTNVDEAGKLSQAIVFLPFYLIRSIFIVLKLLAKEVIAGLTEFLYVIGVKRYDRR